MLTLQNVLELKSEIFKGKRVKLVRHKDGREQYRDAMKNREALLDYQRGQSRDVFKSCDYIISFRGKEQRRAVFFGIFKVNGMEFHNGKFNYDLEQLAEFDEFIERLVIDWGSNARNWHQLYDLQPKEISEILPKGYIGTFPGLLSFVLDFDGLQKLVTNPEANRDWKNHLSSVNGVYMILDTKTGQQYIGSACGEEGIWQRWSNYSKTMTGGNIELKRLLEQDSNYCRHFRYSVLQTLPSNITRKEIDKVERLYKEKFGSRVHGLNLN